MGDAHSMIMIVLGTKAEFIKCMPIMLELQKQNKGYWFVHTGQHKLKDICEEFGVKGPDFVLSKVPKISTKFWSKINRTSLFWFFSTTYKIKKILKEAKPRYVVYHGDTMSTAVASIASSKLFNLKKKWKNVHLEAGLRSGSLIEPFPEEISRHISDYFSDILLAVSDLTKNNLNKYKPRKVIKSGNTIIDSALTAYEKAKKSKLKRLNMKYVLINIHRHENLKSRDRMRKIIEIVSETRIKAIWPLHDNTKHYLEKYGLMEKVKKIENLDVVPLKDYTNFVLLVSNCEYLITDGGSIQEESLIFKKPCIILRKETERQEGIVTGMNFLTKINVEKTKRIIQDIESGRIKFKRFNNPYGEKGVSKRILEVLR